MNEQPFSPGGLTTERFGRSLEYYPQIGSTNDRVRELARAGAREGLLVVADEQTAGRGSHGRSWLAPPGGAILASLLLRPQRPAGEVFAPVMILGLAVRAALAGAGAPAALKWPNDVLCRGLKIAGILCELAMSGGVSDFVIAGFGVNIDFDPAAYGLSEAATSLRLEVAGALPSRQDLLNSILCEAEARYIRWQQGNYLGIWQEWRDRLATLGSEVRVDTGDGRVEGMAIRVERDGTLIVSTPQGERRLATGTILLG
ncbi:MAG: biotin--[acetyl-CoA-carboxylase] ligase [Chloroflexia bacterium]